MVDTITTDLNPVPSRKSPSTFPSRMDTWLNKIPTWTDEANALATGANANKLAAEAAETNAKEWAENPEDVEVEAGQYSAKHHAAKAADSETNAAASASEAESFAQSAINAPGTSATSTTSVLIGTGPKSLTIQTGKDIAVGMFVLIARTSAPENYMAGQVTSYNSETGALVVFVDSVGGSGTYTDWTVSLSAITFDVASEAEMQAGTETAIRTMSPALIAAHVNARIDYQEFTTSGTWTKPDNATVVYVEAVGGGGGGNSGAENHTIGGGGGGEGVARLFAASSLEASVLINIGGGGAGSTSEAVQGSAGGNTTFGSHVTARGAYPAPGPGSGYVSAISLGNSGGGGASGAFPSEPYADAASTYSCGGGGTGGYTSSPHGCRGGNSYLGGGGGGGCIAGSHVTSPGSSVMAGDGGAASYSSVGSDGGYPGGGGGAGGNSYAGGNGGNGRLRIWSW